MKHDRWIVIARWNDFQHYKNRDPLWIKTYTRLLRDDDYLDLSGHLRAVLHGLWLLAAENDGCVRDDTAMISRRLALRVTTPHIESLNHAGFIQLSASKPLAKCSPETETEKETSTAVRTALLESLELPPDYDPDPEPKLDPDPVTSAYSIEGAIIDLVRKLPDRDDGTEGVIRALVKKHHLNEGAIRTALEASQNRAKSPTRVAVAELQRQAAQRQARANGATA